MLPIFELPNIDNWSSSPSHDLTIPLVNVKSPEDVFSPFIFQTVVVGSSDFTTILLLLSKPITFIPVLLSEEIYISPYLSKQNEFIFDTSNGTGVSSLFLNTDIVDIWVFSVFSAFSIR